MQPREGKLRMRTCWKRRHKEQFGGLTSPGRCRALKDLQPSHRPLLILMDVVLEYVTKATGVRVGDSTLASRTIAFMHKLTELAPRRREARLVGPRVGTASSSDRSVR